MSTACPVRFFAALIALLGGAVCFGQSLVLEGTSGPGLGKHVVFIAAEWEYRSEECLPMLARILAERYGFKCTVVFPINAAGEIDPNVDDNVPGLEALDSADLAVTLMMMLQLPDGQMKHVVEYVEAGKPVIGLRCSVLAFKAEKNPQGTYANYQAFSKAWPGGFGQQVLGETWRNHYGVHRSESTWSAVDGVNRAHPILKGITHCWGPTDVYQVDQLPADATVLMRGVVLAGMKPDAPPNHAKAIMPTAWIRKTPLESGKVRSVLTCTMGCGDDFRDENLRRLVVNGAFWALGMEDQIAEKTDVAVIGTYVPSPFGRDLFRKGVKPGDLR